MDYGAMLFMAILVLYGAAAVFYLWGLAGGPRLARHIASASVSLGLVTQGTAFVVRGIELHRMPLTNLSDAVAFCGWVLVAIYLVVERRYRGVGAVGAIVAVTALIAVAFTSILPSGVSDTLVPALRSRWSIIHVATSLIGYAGFTLALIAAAVYTVQERMLKSKKIHLVQRHMPSLEVMDHLAYKMVALAFPMFTLGIITGSLWAQTAWGAFWSWDPKEMWSLITWLVSAA